MISRSVLVFSCLLISALSGCTLDGIKRGVYENQGRKLCQDKSQGLDCDFGPKTYDVYKKEYEQLQPQRPAMPANESSGAAGAEAIK